MRLTEILQKLFDIQTIALPDEPEGIIRLTPDLSGPDVQLAVFTGENATGKSLVASGFVPVLARDAGIEPIVISMANRTSPGIGRCLVYGDEQAESTGYISVRALLSAIQTCQSRQSPHLLILDEPEIGLSPRYQAALGKLLDRHCSSLPAQTMGVILATHSKTLVRQVRTPFHFLRFGDSKNFAEWLHGTDDDAEPEELEQMLERGLATFRAISNFTRTK